MRHVATILLALLAAPALAAPFDPLGNVDGCFLLYDLKKAELVAEIGRDRARRRFPACSTFKVPLAVMAFDAGVLRDETQVLAWDGRKDPRPECNRDHDARSWMRDSVVWFSQRLTPALGAKRVARYLRGFSYGNRDLAGGLTQAWLVSPAKSPSLAISAHEQLAFLRRLWRDRLPASRRAMRLAREMTRLETSPKGFVLSGKTGSNFYDTRRTLHLGWFIAHLRNNDEEYLAVVNFSDRAPFAGEGFGGMRAKAMLKKLLAARGLW